MFHRAPGLELLLAAAESGDLLAARQEKNDDSFLTSIQPLSRFDAYGCLTFYDMIRMMASSQSQDDRDHIYAFVGFAPFLLRHIRVDYSLSVEETFAAMMKALVKESGSLDFLENLPTEADISKSKLKLPSWVPNWACKTSHVPILCHDNLFNSAGVGYGLPSVKKCKHNRDPPLSPWNELIVAGRIIDTVLYKLRPYSVYQVIPSLEVDFNDSSAALPWDISTLNRFVKEMMYNGFPERRNICLKALLRTLLMD